jgi:hypothetical protein
MVCCSAVVVCQHCRFSQQSLGRNRLSRAKPDPCGHAVRVGDLERDRAGRRWLSAWREDTKRQTSKTPRVRVEMRQLKQWYRTLDQLLERKSDIERTLYLTLRDLFSLQVEWSFTNAASRYVIDS